MMLAMCVLVDLIGSGECVLGLLRQYDWGLERNMGSINEFDPVWYKGRKVSWMCMNGLCVWCSQVFSTIDGMKFDLPKTVEDVAPVSQLISEAYKEIDKAVAKGILHRNTAARRKSRLGRAKTGLMVESGLYTPPPPPAA